jgi:HECT-domain (ubiquitin-transferase)
LCPEEGSGAADLIPNGRDVEVNATNVYDYVRRYAEYRMLRAQDKALEVRLFFITIGIIIKTIDDFSGAAHRRV